MRLNYGRARPDFGKDATAFEDERVCSEKDERVCSEKDELVYSSQQDEILLCHILQEVLHRHLEKRS